MKNWRKRLNKKLVNQIYQLEPEDVDFEFHYPIYTRCKIKTKDGRVGVGYAICSIKDEFDQRVGKNKAAGRAVKALVKQKNCDYVRSKWDKIPNTWTKKQIDRLLRFKGLPKSCLVER